MKARSDSAVSGDRYEALSKAGFNTIKFELVMELFNAAKATE